MTSEIKQKSEISHDDRPIIITYGMWDDLHREIALLKQERVAFLHATGVQRFDPDFYDLEAGEDKVILAKFGYTDVYGKMNEETLNMAKEKGELIFEYMIEEQKKCPKNQVFLLKTKHVCDLFGIKSRSTAINWMEQTQKMFLNRVVLKLMKGGMNGYWAMMLTADEIEKLNPVR